MSGLSSFDDAVGLERVTAALRRLPPADAQSTERIVAQAMRQRRVRHARRSWLARAAGIALVAGVGVGGVVAYRTLTTRPGPGATVVAAVSVTVAPPTSASFATNGADRTEAPIAVPFALRRPTARRVALVGDFDDWSPTAIPMTRDAAGTWTTTVELIPGRHAYAFVVDDSVWVADPRADVVRDPDYGRSHSVLLVGRP